MKHEVTLVDYGVGNLFSVARALEQCGADVRMSADPDVVRRAPRLLLPGVGAFGNGMDRLVERSLDQAVKEAVVAGASLLGVCLGMQFLLDSSEEFEGGKGLGLIPGSVRPIPATTADGARLKIPHIGWSELLLPPGRNDWKGSLLAPVSEGTPMYFVHSFMACPDDPAHRLADCRYGDTSVSAMIVRDRVWGAQFHPEKSGEHGLAILRQFVAQT